MAACSGWESRPPEDFRATPETMGSAELCEQWLGLHRQPYPYPPDLYGVSLPPISLEKGCNTPPRSSRPPGGGGGGPHASSHWPPLFGMTSSPFSSGHSFRGVAEDELIVRGPKMSEDDILLDTTMSEEDTAATISAAAAVATVIGVGGLGGKLSFLANASASAGNNQSASPQTSLSACLAVSWKRRLEVIVICSTKNIYLSTKSLYYLPALPSSQSPTLNT
ncbi:hypothetical protein C0Q70_00170 [Pomacea canaliculata]|uniref:Uncharacterized protein n=1 Tax=Pomacea canaliculata TaxID=400727 RepID=A0A2T7PVW9_POMCA|nr:hypothetical protein C0Q70_00170 [Pomacea canaliculata]